MKTRKTLVTIDLFIQMFLFGIAALSSLFALITFDTAVLLFGTSLFVLGFWEVMSAIILGIMMDDEGKYYYTQLFYKK